jgi:hypothetical protein
VEDEGAFREIEDNIWIRSGGAMTQRIWPNMIASIGIGDYVREP